MSSHRTLLRATAVVGKADAEQAHPAHNTKSEDQLMARLAGKVAVITGGSSGIGLATAQRFVDEGASVYIVGRRQSELHKAKALIGDGLSTVAGDVTIGTDLDRLFRDGP
jgi:NADPH:quinone reductase-like Zn-dependent oxidoreductase